MINASELRLGNWYIFDDEPTKFTFQIIKDMEFEDEYIGEPITLSPEMLEKFCSLVNKVSMTWRVDLPNREEVIFLKLKEVGNNTNYLAKLFSYGTSKLLKEVSLLHNLQNLYYALTQTELPVNL